MAFQKTLLKGFLILTQLTQTKPNLTLERAYGLCLADQSLLYSLGFQDLKETLKTTIINFSYLNEKPGNYASKLNVFGKDKEPCMKCRNQIEKFKIFGRGTYICNHCQKIFR